MALYAESGIDHVMDSELNRKYPALLRDNGFWAALLLGLAGCWLLALVVKGGVETTFVWSRWRDLLWLVVLYPVIEEWIFRGLLQPWLLSRAYGRVGCCGVTMANLMVTLLFAGLHLITHPVGWALLVIVPSLIYGWFRDRYNSILPGVLLHCSYNFGYFILFGLPVT